jgi:hypothetical protein
MTGNKNRLCGFVACHAGAFVILAVLASGTAWAAQPVSKKTGPQKKMPPKSLEDELFQGLDQLPAVGKERPGKSSADQGPEVDQDRQRRLTQGEDVGQESERNSWLRIGTSMENVRGRLAVGDLGRETQQLQKMISQDLSDLMKQLRQQSNGSSFRPGAGAAASAGIQDSDDPSSSSKPATDSSQRVGKGNAEPVEAGEAAATMEELWGYLPARVQAQLRGSAADQFLPKYERLLEAFYRRLAEQADERP